MKPEELERMIHAARDYNEPPEPPRDEMWAVIREELPQGRETDDLAGRRARHRLRRGTPWVVGLAAAATLAVGFGLGRMTREPAPAHAPMAAAERSAPSTPVRLAAAEHMSDAEALLTLFRSSAASTDDRAATADWARDLLATTRLLLDSRVAEDPEMAGLLGDLELVLVQIANSGGAGDDDLIEEGIRQQQLLTKLRTAAAPADISL
ncbi:MAG: hypothetical protein R6U63_05150 [Longimicrobiales bacterium]